jgi:hydroxymethylpyrimidine pyrophosphatase-like HAD family hydrolase
MIKYAGTGVAMGNAVPELKELADEVTSDVNQDGILNGLKKVGLL